MASPSSAGVTGVQSAQIAFLAIYNPSLGPTDDSFAQQLVFYYSRAAHEARIAARKNARNEAAGGDAVRAAENEKLRRIGLAQGMVDFARSFSNGEPVDCIETERSRIVLRELERGWWILASVDLTRLPSLSPSASVSSKKEAHKTDAKPSVEYSSREVSPPALLLEQLQQAHHLFCLHHGPSLSDLWVRLSRDKFCSTLDRFWTRYARSWDVLLHGNPAADVFTGLKVSSGGELGFGVGEEEWGSGERDVLEDLTRRTEGLVDLVVSRFGEPKPTEKEQSTVSKPEGLPWMGSGREPTASDGVVFGGVGGIERKSLRDISLWMRSVYTYGDHAYGIGDNPQRERRKRRRRNPVQPHDGASDSTQTNARDPSQSTRPTKRDEANGPARSGRPKMHPNVASHDHAAASADPPHANIPPAIAVAAEQALDKAIDEADKDPEREAKGDEETAQDEAAATTLGIPDQYMKYLTFGLSTLAKPAPRHRPPNSRTASTTGSSRALPSPAIVPTAAEAIDDDDEGPALMTQLLPMSDGESLRHKIAMQKRLENEGYFVVGLKGDLNAPAGDDEADATDGSFGNEMDGSRIVLRTVQVKVVPRSVKADDEEHDIRRPSLPRSASASEATKGYRRLRAIIFARRPFIYCFLFDANTSSLQYTSFYRNLRQDLVPIHNPLLSSTSAANVAQRIENSHLDSSPADTDAASVTSRSSKNTLPSKTKTASPAPIFDLIYDPRLLTVHTSIPNIPEPGTPAAEGIFSTTKTEPAVPGWTRIEAMNVHSQILNTLASVKKRKLEVERTSKTSRGWWVVWMKVPPSASSTSRDQPPPTNPGNGEQSTTSHPSLTAASTPAVANPIAQDLSRIAFLVRRATDAPPSSPTPSRFVSASSSKTMSTMFSNMTFGLAGGRSEEATGGASAGWGPQALTGGMGVDARRYVEGLLSLGR